MYKVRLPLQQIKRKTPNTQVFPPTQTQTRRASELERKDIHKPSPQSYRPNSESVHSPSCSISAHSTESGGGNDTSSPSESNSIKSTAASSFSANKPEYSDQLQVPGTFLFLIDHVKILMRTSQTLLQKLHNNKAEIEANEAQIRALEAVDVQVSTGIQTRLAAVQSLNERLDRLSQMLARVEDVGRGEF